jgi:hypothetical protein
MITATFLAIFFIPLFYVFVVRLLGGGKKTVPRHDTAAPAAAPAPEGR